MPVYEYQCESCGKPFEKLQRTMSSTSKASCPECGSSKTSRMLSVFAVAADSQKQTAPASGPGSCGRCGGAPGSCSM